MFKNGAVLHVLYINYHIYIYIYIYIYYIEYNLIYTKGKIYYLIT